MNNPEDSDAMQEAEGQAGDIHICGTCKVQFHDIETFLIHKRQACTATTAPRSNSLTSQSQLQKTNEALYHNNNNTDEDQEAVTDIEPQEETLEVTTHTQEVSFGGDCEEEGEEAGGQEDATEEVMFIEVPADNVGHLEQGLDPGGAVVSLQSALMSSQPGQVTMISQSGCDDTHETTVVTSPTSVVQQLLTSTHLSSHNVEEYNTAQSLLQVLQGGVEVTPATAQDLQFDATQQTVTSSPSKGLKKVSLLKKFHCNHEDCSFITAYQKDLDRHKRIHTGERPFTCLVCNKAFNRADKLKIHVRAHAGNKPYACSHCNYTTSDSSSLKKHLRIHTDERPFKCQICQYASRNSSQLIVHLRTHTGDAPFQCQLCAAKFKINSDLKRHMRLHTGEKPYRCEHCDYRCAIKGNLKTHYKINHSTDRVLGCGQCEFKTSSRRALREHVKTHDAYECTYRCPVCKYTCASRTTLKVHLRIHSNDRPYKCRFCSFTSKQSGNVGTHMRRKHADMLRGGSVSKLIRREGEDMGGLGAIGKDKRNVGRLRPVVKKPFKCTKCEASFVRQDSLRSHTRHHKEVERDMAQKLESTVQAVLQLSTPVNLDPNRNRPAGGPKESSGSHHVPEASVGAEIINSMQDFVVEEVTAVDADPIPQPAQPVTQQPPPPIVRPAPAPQPPRRAAQPVRTTHSHNQVISNRLAFVQNNQNQAIEENFQNAAINNRRIAEAAAAAAAASSTSSVSSSSSKASSTAHKAKTSGAASVSSNNGPVSISAQPRIVRVMGHQQQHVPKTATVVAYTAGSNPRVVMQSPNRSIAVRTVLPQQTKSHSVKPSTPASTVTHQQSHLPQQQNTVTTSIPIVQQQLATTSAGAQHHQLLQQQQQPGQDPKPIQVTFQVPQTFTQAVSSSPVSSTAAVTNNLQVVTPQGRTHQVVNAPTLLTLQQPQQHQQQQQQMAHAGTPVSVQIVQNGTGGSSLVPQQVQVLLPASALTQTSGGVQVAQPATYQQQVILQVPAGAEGLLDSSGQMQIPVPLRILPSQQQVIQQFQQTALPQQVHPQVITLQAEQYQPEGQQQQQQQHVDVQQLQQQQQMLQQQQIHLQQQIQQGTALYSHRKAV